MLFSMRWTGMVDVDGTVGPPPSAVMIGFLRGFQISQALYVVAELGVATILEQEGPGTVAELARRTGAHPEALGRLIRTLRRRSARLPPRNLR